MKKQDVIDYFGSVSATARVLGITHVAVGKWNESIPKGRAYQIEVLTGGKLKAEQPNTAPGCA